ncbi:hypothetical protein FQA47_015499 [Oryzias melastigma]|uniref:Uncharacterized protein n=1 Tax=Oryzias melastigma TaxID=30732 RepID=A0A834FQD4_ORYME|nr:hypothetical protein FQA47_015499 [Oryzias melastigma]
MSKTADVKELPPRRDAAENSPQDGSINEKDLEFGPSLQDAFTDRTASPQLRTRVLLSPQSGAHLRARGGSSHSSTTFSPSIRRAELPRKSI